MCLSGFVSCCCPPVTWRLRSCLLRNVWHLSCQWSSPIKGKDSLFLITLYYLSCVVKRISSNQNAPDSSRSSIDIFLYNSPVVFFVWSDSDSIRRHINAVFVVMIPEMNIKAGLLEIQLRSTRFCLQVFWRWKRFVCVNTSDRLVFLINVTDLSDELWNTGANHLNTRSPSASSEIRMSVFVEMCLSNGSEWVPSEWESDKNTTALQSIS